MTLSELTQVCKYCSMPWFQRLKRIAKREMWPSQVSILNQLHFYDEILTIFFREGSRQSFVFKKKSFPEVEKFGVKVQKPPLDKESYHQIQMYFCKNSCINVKVCYHRYIYGSFLSERTVILGQKTDSRRKYDCRFAKIFYFFFAFLEVFQEEWFVFERSASSTLWLDFLKKMYNSSATR